MGAQKSIHAGKAKIDVNVDLTHKLCRALMVPSPPWESSNPLSEVVGSFCIKHPNLFGKSEKLDVSWDKGLYDTNVSISLRKPRHEWLSQQSFVFQHSNSPEVRVHGPPVDNFTRSGASGVNLRRFSAGVDINEPRGSLWSSTLSVKFEHVRPVNNDGRPMLTDSDGLPITFSGNPHDNMAILKQESNYAIADDRRFTKLNFQIEQGLPLLSKWLIFNKFKFTASKGVKLGPAFFLTSFTGGSIVGDMAPYQAFAIGGFDSIRGYGEGAVGSGRSCVVMNSEVTIPLAKGLNGAFFVDCGSDLGSSHLVPGNPALRQGKPGSGFGLGFGIRLNSPAGNLKIDYAMNAFQQKTVYIGIGNIASRIHVSVEGSDDLSKGPIRYPVKWKIRNQAYGKKVRVVCDTY